MSLGPSSPRDAVSIDWWICLNFCLLSKMGIHYRGCSGRGVQRMGVVLCSKTAYDVM